MPRECLMGSIEAVRAASCAPTVWSALVCGGPFMLGECFGLFAQQAVLLQRQLVSTPGLACLPQDIWVKSPGVSNAESTC